MTAATTHEMTTLSILFSLKARLGDLNVKPNRPIRIRMRVVGRLIPTTTRDSDTGSRKKPRNNGPNAHLRGSPSIAIPMDSVNIHDIAV